MTVTIDGTLGITTPAATVSGALSAASETFTATPVVTTAQSMIFLSLDNGYGATNTVIRRFTNTITSQGADITYADSATLGASFTINTNGVYAISYSDNLTASGEIGISLNSNQLTTSIASITAANRLAEATVPSANATASVSWIGYLASGSVIRAHTAGTAAGSVASEFTITRVA